VPRKERSSSSAAVGSAVILPRSFDLFRVRSPIRRENTRAATVVDSPLESNTSPARRHTNTGGGTPGLMAKTLIGKGVRSDRTASSFTTSARVHRGTGEGD